jgi:hypothetical protein
MAFFRKAAGVFVPFFVSLPLYPMPREARRPQYDSPRRAVDWRAGVNGAIALMGKRKYFPARVECGNGPRQYIRAITPVWERA